MKSIYAYLFSFSIMPRLLPAPFLGHGGGNSVKRIALPKVASGLYTIGVRSPDTQFIKKLIIK